MIKIASKALIMLAKPVVLSIIEDVIKSGVVSEQLQGVKKTVINAMLGLTRKTHFSWDDRLAGSIIAHLEEHRALDDLSVALLDSAEAWVKASETKWDDSVILPILVEFRKVLVGSK